MILAALLLQAAAPPPEVGPDIRVTAPLPAAPQTAATMVLEPAAMLIATFDADGDALVDRGEINVGLEASFGAAAMRYVAYADWAARWLGDRNALPSPFEVDRNGDDSVTLEELQDHFSRLFARYDKDGSRAISRAELLTFRTAPIGADGPAGVRPLPPGEAKSAPRGRRGGR